MGYSVRKYGVMEQTTRFLPEIDFPPYTYVPAQTPHPVSDPGGHQFGLEPEQPATTDFSPDQWLRSRDYLHGIDLFNHGYYWEAHEAWEAVWHAAGRSGPTADLLKGLIKLAAAGVKTRAGSLAGRRRHCRRAAELFRQAESPNQTELPSQTEPVRQAGNREGRRGEPDRLLGLPLASLAQQAAEAADDSPGIEARQQHPPRVFPFLLLPADVHADG